MRFFRRLLVSSVCVVCAAGVASFAQAPNFNLGRTPSAEEIKALDLSVSPTGKELPPGSGTAKEGAAIFARKCAACHGPTGSEGKAPHLVADPSKPSERVVPTYWPFATTLFDYIRRAMPLNQEGSLRADEVYSLDAFLLFKNGIIQETDVMDAKSLPQVKMPNRDGYKPPPITEWKPGMPRPFKVEP